MLASLPTKRGNYAQRNPGTAAVAILIRPDYKRLARGSKGKVHGAHAKARGGHPITTGLGLAAGGVFVRRARLARRYEFQFSLYEITWDSVDLLLFAERAYTGVCTCDLRFKITRKIFRSRTRA